jgi:hypothetical protein
MTLLFVMISVSFTKQINKRREPFKYLGETEGKGWIVVRMKPKLETRQKGKVNFVEQQPTTN